MKHKRILAACLLAAMMMNLTACTSKDTRSPSANLSHLTGAVMDEAECCEDVAMPDVDVNTERYAQVDENGFKNVADAPLSTFSADVDTASYANVRRMIREGYVDPNAVRLEEMINYFHYSYPAPADDAPLSVTTEMADCPWNTDNQLFLIGLQAEKIDLSDRAPMNLVFLIDVSGSMYESNKLPLVQKAVTMLAEELGPQDRISIVTYAGSDSVVLDSVPGNELTTITDAVYSLQAGGSTAGEMGIKRAYEIAEKNFIKDGNNRILLATDGDLNVGISDPDALTKLVEKKRKSGVSLSVLGFGTGNIKDDNMEALADHGNGNYAYIDSALEARRVLVEQMGGTLYTVAKDVKLQVEFDPAMVERHRLIGYENRMLADEDFANDDVDAGEIGSGHSMTALYELALTEAGKAAVAETGDNSLLTVSMRYKAPDGDESQLRSYPVTISGCRTEPIGRNLAFAAAVAEFGMLLGEREAGSSSYSQIKELLTHTDIQDPARQEFAKLVEYLK